MSFGTDFNTAPDAAARLALEESEQRRGDFAALDRVLAGLLLRALTGEAIFRYDSGRNADLLELDAAEAAVIGEHFSVTGQETKGAWFVPESGPVSVGAIHAVRAGKADPRLMMSVVDRRGRARPFAEDPAWFAAWAVLEPFFASLVRPLDLRGSLAGKYDAKRLEKEWAAINGFYADLGLEADAELDVLRPGGGWSRLSAQDKTQVRAGLLEAWTTWASPSTVGRIRTWALGQLVQAYYKKAKGSGQAQSRKVLTKPLQRTLSGYFAGDWLAFLAYVGEQPHPGEEIITALPEAKLFVAQGARAEAVAADEGVAASEVERMLAAFYNDEQAASPVLQRVEALERFWQAFDQLHAEKAPDADTLWGLLQEEYGQLDHWQEGFEPGLAARRLPAETRADILTWWGTSVLTRAPLRLVSQADPLAAMVAAFGPALTFWHEAGLVAFAQCQARGFPRYSLKEFTATYRPEAKRFGVDPEFFRELVAAEELLPPEPEPDDTGYRHAIEVEGHPELELEVRITLGSGTGPRKARGGFPILRELITRYRRHWAAEHLQSYLRARWETDLREVAETYNRLLIAKGKPPTARQVVKEGQDALDRWFGGDVDQLHRALGQRSPGKVERAELLLPDDRRNFMLALRRQLGGVTPPDPKDFDRQADQTWTALTRLAEQGPQYVQMWEALGRRPEPKEFRLTGYADYLSADGDEAFVRFAAAVERALADPTPGPMRQYWRPGLTDEEPTADPAPQSEPARAERRGLLRRLLG